MKLHTKTFCAMTVLAVSTVQAGVVIHVDVANCPGPGDGSELDPYCSIQSAIANAVDTDQIVVAPGTYFEAIDFIGKAIWLHSTDGPAVTTIDGTGNFHVVQCVSGEGSGTILSGLTITGGNADGASPDIHGGGMYNVGSSPTVTDCVFIENTASSRGGGMYNNGSSPIVFNCTFEGNTAGGGGGGMRNDASSPLVLDCSFIGNTALGSAGGMGNTDGSNPTVTNCTFSNNDAAFFGGGMFNGVNNPTVTNCTFKGGTANAGGGMFNGGGSPTVTNCTFEGNTAIIDGGGIGMGGSSPTITNCTFSGNVATVGGALITRGPPSAPSNPTLSNCVLWGNGADQIVDGAGSATSVFYSNVQGGFTGTGNTNTDPLFVNPGNGDLRLQPGSPCIDAADNTAVPAGTTTDLDGEPRFVDDPDTIDSGNGGPPVVDMGAYEFQGGSTCPWDCESAPQGTVGINDFLDLLAQWGTPGSCDFDGAGVGINDFLALLSNWGPCP